MDDKLLVEDDLIARMKSSGLFFEDDYLPIGYAQAALLFTIIFPTIGIIVWRKELDNDIRTM